MDYTKLGFDAFLNRGPGAVGSNVRNLADINRGFQSALRMDSNTEALSLGQAPMTASDGKTVRLIIGRI